jgi:hypothetical protein
MVDAAPSGVPTGVGVFTRALRSAIVGSPQALADRAKSLGLSFVPMLACWQDARGLTTPNDHALGPYARALHDAGIDTWLWGYPWAGGEETFVNALVSRAKTIGARGVILDPEVSYKARPQAMRALVARTIDALDESLGAGFTSFGLPALHPTFPWKEAAALGWGCPQDYDVTLAQTLESVDAWGELGWESIVPALPTFGRGSAPSVLDRAVDALAARPNVRGLVFWSWNQLDEHDEASITRAADLFRSSTAPR